MNADISTEKAAGDAADGSLEAKIDADVSTEKAARENADKSIEDVVAANDKQFLQFKSNVQTSTDSIESRISTEEEAREEADSSLDTRVNEAVFNTTPGVDSMDEMITGFNDAMSANVQGFFPRKYQVELGDYDSEKGLLEMSRIYQPESFMFFINGLLAEEGEDYDLVLEEDKTFEFITLLGDAKTLADNGAKMAEYGINNFGQAAGPGSAPSNISQVTSAIVDPNPEGEGEDEGKLGGGK